MVATLGLQTGGLLCAYVVSPCLTTTYKRHRDSEGDTYINVFNSSCCVGTRWGALCSVMGSSQALVCI